MATFTPLQDDTPLRKAVLPSPGDAVPLGIVIDKACRVYIADIPVTRIERDGADALRQEFESFGPVESYRLFTERSGRFVGKALCTYRNPADAALAVANMNNQVIDETTLHVELARDHGVVVLRRTPYDATHGAARTSADSAYAGGSNNNGGGGSSRGVRLGGEGSRHGRGFLAPTDEGAKWSHDKYQMQVEGRDAAEIFDLPPGRTPRPGRGRGRGRGGRYESRNARTEREFEQYIAERDRMLGIQPSNNYNIDETGGAEQTQPQPQTQPQQEQQAPAENGVQCSNSNNGNNDDTTAE